MKLKTHKGAAKRLRFTKKGKMKRSRARRRHLLTVGKTESRKRHLRKAAYVGPSEAHRMRRLMPYG